MRILVYSRIFRPSIGGVETIAEMLAEGFAEAGHRVVVATAKRNPDKDVPAGYDIVRRPSVAALWRLARRADVCLSMNVALRGIAPLLLSGRPILVSHQNWYFGNGESRALAMVKNGVSRLTTNVFCSEATRARMPAGGTVIPNAYDDRVFRRIPDIDCTGDLVFVGRLVPEKGLHDLLKALSILRAEAFHPRLTVVGHGPSETALRLLTEDFGLSDRVTFAGAMRDHTLAREINRHRVLVVPSAWEEPFGIVALEGAACGCIVVGTRGGGLPDAIGPCGVLATRGDPADLALKIRAALSDQTLAAAVASAASRHLAKHTRARMVEGYLDEIIRAQARES